MGKTRRVKKGGDFSSTNDMNNTNWVNPSSWFNSASNGLSYVSNSVSNGFNYITGKKDENTYLPPSTTGGKKRTRRQRGGDFKPNDTTVGITSTATNYSGAETVKHMSLFGGKKSFKNKKSSHKKTLKTRKNKSSRKH
jgi:hypothetical protein